MRGTSSLLRNVLSNWIVMAISLAYTFTITPLVVRTLGVERYGVWSFLNGLLVYSELLYLGLGSALVKYVAQYRARSDIHGINRLTSVVATIYGLLGLISLGLFALVSGYVPVLFAEPLTNAAASAAVMTCALLGVRMLLVFLTSPFAGLLAGYERYDLGSAVNLVSVVVRFIATPILLRQSWDPLLTMAYLTVGASVIDLVLLGIVAYASISGLTLRVVKPRWTELRWLYGFGLQSFFVVFAVKLISYADTTVIGIVLGAAGVALYSLPLQLVEVARMFIGGFAAVFLPRVALSSEHGDEQAIRDAYLRSMRIAFFLAGWLGAGLITLGPMFLGLWIGPGFGGIPASLLLYLVLALMAQVLSSQVPLPFYQALGLLVVPAVVISIEGGLNIALSIWFAKVIGLPGVALATALPAVISVALLPAYLCRKLDVPLNQLVRSLTPGLVMLIGTIAVERLLAAVLASASWLVLVVRIAVTVPVGFAVMGLMFPEDERKTISRMLRPPWSRADDTETAGT